MNYFAHGFDEIDAPERLAGTALPDWLGAADRGVRLRTERLDESELAAGVRRHHEDDAWFHATEAFQRTTVEVADLFCGQPCYDHGLRGWFLGHVLVEMLVDRCLIERQPDRLDAYYAAVDSIDVAWLEQRVRPWLSGPSSRLRGTVELFRRHRYLYGYLDHAGLFARLCDLARRAGLPQLPAQLQQVVPRAAGIVGPRLDDLMREPCSSS